MPINYELEVFASVILYDNYFLNCLSLKIIYIRKNVSSYNQ